MAHNRASLRILALSLSCLLTACGGGGGQGGVDGGVDGGADGAGDGGVDGGTPGDPALDQALRPLLTNAGVDPLPPAPTANSNLVELGRALFFDKELSGNRNISCATCHHPLRSTGDGLSLPIGQGGTGLGAAREGTGGDVIPRNAPHLFDLSGQQSMFWDRRVQRQNNGTLRTPEPALNGGAPAQAAIANLLTTATAAQAIFPLTSSSEMRGVAGDNELADAPSNVAMWDLLMDRLVGSFDGTVAGFDGYRTLFASAYPTVSDPQDLNIGHVGQAIGAFEDTVFATRESPFDRYLRGEDAAMTDQQKQGGILFFGRANCSRCHQGPLLTDFVPRSIGVPQIGPGRDSPGEDTGLFAETGNPNDSYRFRTPSLRNVELTGPWMHDGAYTTLRAAVAHYDNPARSLANYNESQLSPSLQGTVDRNVARQDARAAAIDNLARNIRLNGNEIDAITEFLRCLTDPASETMADEIPASVPSGLAVGD